VGSEVAAAELVAYGAGRAHYINVDLPNADACAQFVDVSVRRFGKIDVIINNAASVARSTLESTDADFFDTMMAINVRAPLLIMRPPLPYLRANHQRCGSAQYWFAQCLCGCKSLAGLFHQQRSTCNHVTQFGGAHRHEGIRVQVLNVGWARIALAKTNCNSGLGMVLNRQAIRWQNAPYWTIVAT
jgi:NAD(P)-dependent dehydrogenase (short-subunit alcohol dehydrogenase family)